MCEAEKTLHFKPESTGGANPGKNRLSPLQSGCKSTIGTLEQVDAGISDTHFFPAPAASFRPLGGYLALE
jgi:hypothetical protein